MDNNIVIFITNNSPLSKKVEMYLKINNIQYGIMQYDELEQETKDSLTGEPPVVIKGNQALFGFDAKQLNQLLKGE